MKVLGNLSDILLLFCSLAQQKVRTNEGNWMQDSK